MGRTKGSTTNSEASPLRTGKGRGRHQGENQGPPQKTGFDGRLEAPWRKTVSTFKMPCTLVHTTSKRTQKPPTKLNIINEREKGRQVCIKYILF